MTNLLFQAFLLMASAYFLGAFLGCWWRRAFYEPAKARTARRSDWATAAAGAAAAEGAVPLSRTAPIPLQPRIEHVDSPEKIAARHRFERALSGTGALEEAQHGAACEQHYEEPALPAAEGGADFEIAPHAPAEREPPAAASYAPPPVPQPDPAAACETDDAVSAATAAAAAAMGVAARPRAAVPRPPEPSPALPVAAPGGMAGSTAEASVPPLMPTDGQDLKFIRSIDEETEHKLNSLGVWRYSDIVRWTHGDVAAINAALETHTRVQRENWIEQATILSKGGQTAYARRRLRGEFVGAQPSGAVQPSRAPATATPPPRDATTAYTAKLERPPGSPASMANAVAAAGTAGNRGHVAASHRPPPTVRAPRPVITEIASTSPPAAAASAAARLPLPPQGEPGPVLALAPLPSAAAKADVLQRIRGIDQTAERALWDSGVTRYEQIANWTATEVEYFDELLESPGRVSRQNWIEQAQILSRGATTLFARQRESALGLGGMGSAASVAAAAAAVASTVQATPAAARPSRLVDAMRMKQQRAAAQALVQPPAPEPTQDNGSSPVEDDGAAAPTASADQASATSPVGNGVTALRSVCSEALCTDHNGGPAQAVDDLKRVRGIGVLIEKKLNSLGVSSYDQIANWTADDIAHISEVLNFRGRIERENWVEQARILSAGGQTEFSRRFDRGDIS